MTSDASGRRLHDVPAWETELVELAPGVFAYIQATGGFCIANAGLITAGDGVTAIDALFTPRMTQEFLAEKQRVSEDPVRRLIDTHHHVDHTFGNQFFRGAEIIAHARTREEMLRVGLPIDRLTAMAPHFAQDLQGIDLTLPTLTYEGRMTLFCGDRRLELIHLGPAHTVDDTLIYLPEEKILYAGDVAFFYVTPLGSEGNLHGWIDVAQAILRMDVGTIVPGHGPVGGKVELQMMLDYLLLVRDQARRGFDNGLTAEQAAEAIELGPYASWGEPERVLPNTVRLFQEFHGKTA